MKETERRENGSQDSVGFRRADLWHQPVCVCVCVCVCVEVYARIRVYFNILLPGGPIGSVRN